MIDESMMSFFTLETQQQSRQWLLGGSLVPIKAKVQESRKKQMIFAFDSKGTIYTRYALVGSKINANHILEVLANFKKQLIRKRLSLV